LADDRWPASCRLWARDFFARQDLGNRWPHHLQHLTIEVLGYSQKLVQAIALSNAAIFDGAHVFLCGLDEVAASYAPHVWERWNKEDARLDEDRRKDSQPLVWKEVLFLPVQKSEWRMATSITTQPFDGAALLMIARSIRHPSGLPSR
jgi:hypothetical protein